MCHWPSTSWSSWREDSAELRPTQVRWPDIRMSQSALGEGREGREEGEILNGRFLEIESGHLKEAVKSI